MTDSSTDSGSLETGALTMDKLWKNLTYCDSKLLMRFDREVSAFELSLPLRSFVGAEIAT